ncbi:hypothetical protein GOV11_01885, partial [Candidatus Woesearchaeota archaeon]|nr:hypothetical protein [Candidatus Woesearchaeota archaeon]
SAALLTILGIGLIILSFFASSLVGFVVDQDPSILENTELSSATISIIATSVVAGLGVVLLLFGVLHIFVGMGLWKHRNWARIVLLVFAWIGVSYAVIRVLLSSLNPWSLPFTILGSGLSAAVPALKIWLFQFNEDVVGLFK